MAMLKTNFVLKHNHNWSLTELEEMVPFEREIYTMLLLEQLEKERKQQK
jgi:hypothetical protein